MSWFDKLKKLVLSEDQAVEFVLETLEAPVVETVSEIKIDKRTNRHYSFNNLAKEVLGLPSSSPDRISVIKATQVVNRSFEVQPWKKHPGRKVTEDLVKAAATAYGVLEDKDFYFKRYLFRNEDHIVIVVELFVVEDDSNSHFN